VSHLPRIAYLSMEIALEDAIPTYSGGLGVLAGDTLRSAADLALPIVGLSLLYRSGHFEQRLDASGKQSELPVSWNVETHLTAVDAKAAVDIEDRRVEIRCWRYDVEGVSGYRVPVFLLDTDLPQNDPQDRELTGVLYGGDSDYRLRQEVVLGLGGVRMLRALGFHRIDRFHLNEGHAALCVLALLDEQLQGRRATTDEFERAHATVRSHCVFTTHTPVPAGHDVFELDTVEQVLGAERLRTLESLGTEEELNLTTLALACSRYVNGVAMRHAEVSRALFPEHRIDAVTNGIHTRTWVSPPFRALFHRHIRGWEHDPMRLRNAVCIPLPEIDKARKRSKALLFDAIERQLGVRLDPNVLTLGFARRATAYKRAPLIFTDIERLQSIATEVGPLQLVFSGKAHPADTTGKHNIESVFRAARALGPEVRVAYVPNYGMNWGHLLCAGADVWLNNPIPPLEASGTSGMKAALNGVPCLSILDGWWLEGCIEAATGWAIGSDGDSEGMDASKRDQLHAAALYDALERQVVPSFYTHRERLLAIGRNAIAYNASYFNTHRMLLQYVQHAYQLEFSLDTEPLPDGR